jgi:hypothetical protein
MRRLILAVACLPLLIAAYYRVNSPAVMTTAARAFLASLDADQRARATFPMDSEERLNWHFVPFERKGIALREMNSAQKQLAGALLAAGLSQQGVIKAHTIMSLDAVLKELEKGKGPERDPEKYYVTIFGEPSETGVWGYRFEGHHVATNFTIVNGRVASSPNFFGANPAEVLEGPRAGLRALPREEDLGQKLIMSLTPAQRAIAIVDQKAYPDIITMDSRKAALSGQPSGIPFAKLTAKQRDILTELVSEYANNFPGPIADSRMEQYRKTQNNLFFAWAGGLERREPHYYRIQTPAFLIEYDDTQNNANHSHTVWRDFDGDFGMDLLAEHYKSSH